MSMKNPVSDIRKKYIMRLIGRIAVLIICVAAYAFDLVNFEILSGNAFFKQFSLMHILWGVWIADMIFQLLPAGNIALGSQKFFKNRFRPVLDKINIQALKSYIVSTTCAAYKVFIIWGLLIAALGVLRHSGILRDVHLFLTSVLFMCATSSACWYGVRSG